MAVCAQIFAIFLSGIPFVKAGGVCRGCRKVVTGVNRTIRQPITRFRRCCIINGGTYRNTVVRINGDAAAAVDKDFYIAFIIGLNFCAAAEECFIPGVFMCSTFPCPTPFFIKYSRHKHILMEFANFCGELAAFSYNLLKINKKARPLF